MVIHTLRREQAVPASPEACWKFFSDPRNLPSITPPDLGFEIVGRAPDVIYAGLLIQYRVSPLFGLKLAWLTEIAHVERGRYFVDEQLVGPYALWHHEHFFEARADGGTVVRDVVHYSLPLSPLSEILHPILVKPKLDQIFEFRRLAVEKIWGGAGDSPAPTA